MDHFRPVIEVIKWANPRDILTNLCMINRRWQEACDSEELWRDLLPPGSDPQGTSSKLYYSHNFTTSVFVVLPDKLLRCFIGPGTWSEKSLSRHIAIQTNVSATRMSADYLLVIGAKSAKANTFRVNIHSGEVEVLPLLSPHRGWIGVITIERTTYAFGGEDSTGPLQNCNCFAHATMTWTSMHKAGQKRSRFTPCSHANLIYLLGGAGTPGETYDRVSNRFNPLSYSLQYESTISIVHNNQLIVLSPDEVFTKPVGSSKSGQTAHLKKTLYGDVSSGYDPLVCGGHLFFLQREFARVVKFDFSSNTWTSYTYQGEKTHYCLKR